MRMLGKDRFRRRSTGIVSVSLLAVVAVAGAGLSCGRTPKLSPLEQYFSQLEYQPEQPSPTTDVGGTVAVFHPQARAIGMNVLSSGGNAYDAFVATVFAQYVLAEGGTSLAGPLGALVYDAPTQKTEYLDADFNTPLAADGIWTEKDGLQSGKAVLAPSAVAGLEELARRGRLGFARLLEPAIELARDGFELPNIYASILAWQQDLLRASSYGRRTFFKPDGTPLQAGDRLVQPELATFLTNLQRQGSAYMHEGEWGKQFLEVVREKGGRLSEADLRSYRPRWSEPWRTSYQGFEVVGASGRSYGGILPMLALKVVEPLALSQQGHYSSSAPAMTVMMRTSREAYTAAWLFDCLAIVSKTPVCTLDSPNIVYRRLTEDSESIRRRVSAGTAAMAHAQTGSHSYHVIVVDRDGTVVSGTNTIESNPWGTGWFVQGIPLTQGGVVQWGTRPGERRVSPLSMHFLFKDGRLRFALGAISNSLVETSFQLIVNLVDYNLPIEEAVAKPRFGTFPLTEGASAADYTRNWLDPRIDQSIVRALKSKSIDVLREGIVDTGLGAIVSIESDVTDQQRGLVIRAVHTPIPYVVDPFGGTTARTP